MAEEGNKLGFDSTTQYKSAKYILGGGKLEIKLGVELAFNNVMENLPMVRT